MRIGDDLDAGDAAVLNREGDGGEIAVALDAGGGRAVEPDRGDQPVGPVGAGEQGGDGGGAADRGESGRREAAAIGAEAARIAVTTLTTTPTRVALIRLMAYDRAAYGLLTAALAEVA
ncbi:hypothetical protein SAMN05216251_12478 [Actinacidiphila alni]|uniref:Uncharacterized protein n=1 Tax=Actinacidiphila alni TaxID=380248 RepID=A0A1I2KPI1_9ACTN|nr:hypothetical protein SAMN05216251_12478 [Actinacidiphila alni]